LKFLAGEAKKNNLSIGLKNAMAILPTVQDDVQFAFNEKCVEFNECDKYNDFIKTKPVFHIEYVASISGVSKKVRRTSKERRDVSGVSQACAGLPSGMSTVIKTLDLNGNVQFCDGTTAATQVTN
jgi:hypothetical protein